MKRMFCIFMALLFLSGCTLSTIKAPRRSKTRPTREPAVERKAYKPTPRSSAIREKEEILPLGKEEIK